MTKNSPISQRCTSDNPEEVSIEKVGLDGLRQQIQDFEARYSLETSEFYARFLRGQMGDKRDFIVWAGLHDLLQRTVENSLRQEPWSTT